MEEYLRTLWAAYLAYICKPAADHEFEYLCYQEARAALYVDAAGPAEVVWAYTCEV
jgi:hypothetical protein